MLTKVHKKNNHIIIAICDEDLLGKYFEEDDKQIDLRGDFFDGENMAESETGDLARNADIVNLVGKKSIAFGIKEGIIDKKNVKTISGIPYAQAIF
ncbi:DUF424 family protein [Candidatus Woesearchaeota archaeon]|nr:DUF424 family protein [Candidatus Woesearchaeota archaeon]